MEVDPPDAAPVDCTSSCERVVQRLIICGVPEEKLAGMHVGLVEYLKGDKSLAPQLVLSILPTEEDASVAFKEAVNEESNGLQRDPSFLELFRESVIWIQWLMFEEEPRGFLKNLAKESSGQRGVCGAVWGDKDIAYCCRTCEHDHTCAICVPCFQNGNHEGHDYSMMYTRGGCCDCGDETAWKREGFCSRHKGTGQIKSIPDEVANIMCPVLDAFFSYWRDKLSIVDSAIRKDNNIEDSIFKKYAEIFSLVAVEMLLDFCKHSERLLSFVSKRILQCAGLLDLLVRAEQFLPKSDVKKLHELLLKLLGEPVFKYDFAKVFIDYYPVIVNKALKDNDGSVFSNYPLLSTFSVQIFTVPAITPKLVREENLMGVLVGCLGDILFSCIGEDDHLQPGKCGALHSPTIRVIGDIHFVMSHEEVQKYIICELPDIIRAWIRLIALVQGMDPQKRVTGIHIEEESEHVDAGFFLEHYIGMVNSLLVKAALSICITEENGDDMLLVDNTNGNNYIGSHNKVGRWSQESCVSSMSSQSSSVDCVSMVPSSSAWLIDECLKVTGRWLGEHEASQRLSPEILSIARTGQFMELQRFLSKIRSRLDSEPVFMTMELEKLNKQNQIIRVDMFFDGGLYRTETGASFQAAKDEYSSCSSNMDVDIGDGGGSLVDTNALTDLDGFCLLTMDKWPQIAYDVSSKEISFHIPLHRLFSLLLKKLLKTYFGDPELLELTSTCTVFHLIECHRTFFRQVLQKCHGYGFSAFIMEQPLRLRVFCAQVRAGMWRKNGDAVTSTYSWYHTINSLDQGLESDLFLLQCCAALAPPDLFVKRILERYGLMNYLSIVFEHPNEYETTLVQDMLTLIIQIVQERSFCGLSESEYLRRELVCKLAVANATHSQLLKSLPHDLSKSSQLQNTLDQIAIYTKPSGLKQGRYSLRREYWKELDLYRPRWNSRDLQIAEERYERICNACASNIQLPRWTKIYYPLYTLSRIATCKAVLQIVRTVFFYAYFSDNSSQSRAPDGVLLTALHLLSLAVDICYVHKTNSLRDDVIPILAYACDEIDATETRDTYTWKNQSMISLLVSLMRKYKQDHEHNLMGESHCNFSLLIETLLKKIAELDSACLKCLLVLAPEVINQGLDVTTDASWPKFSAHNADERKAKVRQRQAAMLEKMRLEQLKFIASLDASDDSPSESLNTQASKILEEQAQLICSLCHEPDSKSPVSYLVLLQKSRLVSFAEKRPPSWDRVCQSYQEHSCQARNENMDGSGTNNVSSHLVDVVQSAINESSRSGHPIDTDSILDFLRSRFPTIRNIQPSDRSISSNMKVASSAEMIEIDLYKSIQQQLKDAIIRSKTLQGGPSEVDIDLDNGLIDIGTAKFDVLGEYIASLSQEMAKSPSSDDNNLLTGVVLPTKVLQGGPFDGFGPSNCDGVYVSSCGHAVHQECRNRYLSSLRQRFVRRVVYERGQTVDPDQGEFLCPVCRKLANSVLPALYNDPKERPIVDSSNDSPSEFGHFSTVSDLDGKSNARRLQMALTLLWSASNEVGKNSDLKDCAPPKENACSALKPLSRKLAQLYYSERNDGIFASKRAGQSLLLWDSLRYSLIAAEIAARGCRPKIYLDNGLGALHREFEASSGFVLFSLLHAAQRSRSQDRLEVLLRFRGIQLFASALTLGVSNDEVVGASDSRKEILSRNGRWGPFLDVQFWKQAADPVLLHDPFSSLMWVLYCLPLPFLSSSDSLISLVHLFYVVCIFQALFTCCINRQVDLSSEGLSCTVVNQVLEIMRSFIPAGQYFNSNFVNSSCTVKDTIRKLTHPYLRRCSMLWKVLKSSRVQPFCDFSYLWNKPSIFSDDSVDESSVERRDIYGLEQFFQINSLDEILNDNVVRSLALKWCGHFCRDFGSRSYGRMLHTTPSVPFRLMRLPKVYQDLLQRYIKHQCSECKKIINDAVLCLLCGRLCCPTWKPCCKDNDWQHHARLCGVGLGVFLFIKSTQILLFMSARHGVWPSVYLDAFGEEDPDMKRGRPLYLNEERYAVLTHMLKHWYVRYDLQFAGVLHLSCHLLGLLGPTSKNGDRRWWLCAYMYIKLQPGLSETRYFKVSTAASRLHNIQGMPYLENTFTWQFAYARDQSVFRQK